MKNDNLERFIRDHREEFDDAIPSLSVWAGIDRSLDRKQGLRYRLHLLKVAASVTLLLVAGAMIGSYLTAWQAGLSASAKIEDIAPEFVEMERYYQQQISEKVQTLAAYSEEPSVMRDLDQVDLVVEELKSELKNAPEGSEEQIIANLILSYQAKLEILERVLNRVQMHNKRKLKPLNNEISI